MNQNIAQRITQAASAAMRETSPEFAEFASHFAVYREATGGEEGRPYRNFYDLVARHGQMKRSPIIIPDDPAFDTMRPSECFLNAYHGTLDLGLQYVEGYAMADMLIVQHAWLEDADGTVIDPTWVHLEKPIDFQMTYYGIRFSQEFVMRRALELGWVGILSSDWREANPILRHGLVFDERGIATGIKESA